MMTLWRPQWNMRCGLLTGRSYALNLKVHLPDPKKRSYCFPQCAKAMGILATSLS